ncbi:hypothetical protein [Candidatus Poriferisodalis sp.]|uniref:hypothetical protein n=1 Tax=Candidatus Poriferisodalis sp. TaxID=3101277 RepID=UPI003C6FEAF3
MSEEDRSRLYAWLCEQIDEPLAEYLMTCLAPAPLSDLATKSDLQHFVTKDELAGQLDKLRDWIDAKFDRLMDQREADRAAAAGWREADRAAVMSWREADRAEIAAQRQADRTEAKHQFRWIVGIGASIFVAIVTPMVISLFSG